MKIQFIKDWFSGCEVRWHCQAIRTYRCFRIFPIGFLVWSIHPMTSEASSDRIFIQEYKIKALAN